MPYYKSDDFNKIYPPDAVHPERTCRRCGKKFKMGPGQACCDPISPRECDLCHTIYDSGPVHVTQRYADCTFWVAPCCGAVVDDRRPPSSYTPGAKPITGAEYRQAKFGNPDYPEGGDKPMMFFPDEYMGRGFARHGLMRYRRRVL